MCIAVHGHALVSFPAVTKILLRKVLPVYIPSHNTILVCFASTALCNFAARAYTCTKILKYIFFWEKDDGTLFCLHILYFTCCDSRYEFWGFFSGCWLTLPIAYRQIIIELLEFVDWWLGIWGQTAQQGPLRYKYIAYKTTCYRKVESETVW